ncbi:MAG: ABC transporter permease [Alphaproteobacteria bacterium]|nr:ABC transporter permease [Alphaproteobacteria bacterium]
MPDKLLFITRFLDTRRSHLLQLMLFKAYADLKTESARSTAGVLWWVLEPVLHMAVYYLVFAVLMQTKTDQFVVFLLIGLVVWRWFFSTVTQGAASIIAGKNLMQHVHITPSFFPSVSLISQGFKFVITFLILLVFIWLYGLAPSVAYTALPVVLAVQFLFIVGTTYLCSAIVPFLPDLKILLGHFLRAVMFVSGIFFDGDHIPEHLKSWFFANPMAALIEAYRDILIDGVLPDWGHLSYVALFGLLLLLVGKRLLAKAEFLYPRVVM